MAEPLPYLVHTNRELGMMLRGEKPLSVFAVPNQNLDEVFARYLQMFDRHCDSGAMIKRVRPHPAAENVHAVFYALPGEEWRIDEIIKLRDSFGPWTIEHERREGELLGYEDWQNDVWIERFGHTRAVT